MSKSIGNKPAYARPGNEYWSGEQPGLTFREVLIVAAVQGLCANHSVTDGSDASTSYTAESAIKQADAVIAALEKEQGK